MLMTQLVLMPKLMQRPVVMLMTVALIFDRTGYALLIFAGIWFCRFCFVSFGSGLIGFALCALLAVLTLFVFRTYKIEDSFLTN